MAWAWWVCQNPLLISQVREWDEWGSWSSYWYFNGIPTFFGIFPDTSGNISSIFPGIVYLYMGFPIFGFAMASGYSLTPMKMSWWPSSSWENHPSLDSRETVRNHAHRYRESSKNVTLHGHVTCESCYAETCARIAGSIFDYFTFSRSLAFPGAFQIKKKSPSHGEKKTSASSPFFHYIWGWKRWKHDMLTQASIHVYPGLSMSWTGQRAPFTARRPIWVL